MVQSSLMISEYERITFLSVGKVFAVYPQANMVDVLLLNGTLLERVQVSVPFASSRSGIINLSLPKYKDDLVDNTDATIAARQGEVDVFVIVGFISGSLSNPIVLGFLFPEENELLCDRDQKGNKDGSMFLWKHDSNVYARIAKGDPIDKPTEIEVSHPSGLLIKIGDYDSSKTVGDQRTEIDNYDKSFRPFKFKNPESDKFDPAPYVHLYHPSGTYLTVDKDGNVKIYVIGNVDKTVHGDVTELIEGKVTRTVNGDVEETFKKDVKRTVEGNDTDEVKKDVSRTVEGNVQETCQKDWSKEVTGTLTDKGATIEHNP